MKRLLAMILLLLVLLSSCTKKPASPAGTEETGNASETGGASKNALVLASAGKTEYTVLRADEPTDWEKEAAVRFKKRFREVTGADADMTTDYENLSRGTSDRQEKEIIIGTCADEGKSYKIDRKKLTDLGYVVMTVGEKVVIAANNAVSLDRAMDAFFNEYLIGNGEEYTMERGKRFITLDALVADTTDIGIWYSVWYTKEKEYSKEMPENTWTAWDLGTVSLLSDGTYGTYDTLDEKEINFHLDEMTKAGIDFIIMDQTNNIDVSGGVINRRALNTARLIKEWNDAGNTPIRYCSAIGGIQWSRDYATVENEAKMLWERYVNTDLGSEKYHYYLNGKPVLVAYGADEEEWNAYKGKKTYAEKFTIRFGTGTVGNKKEQWGWAATGGCVYSGLEESALVMPGWRNRVGYAPVLRKEGAFYRSCWETILNSQGRPRVIIINSFNEFAERTGVFPSDASAEPEKDDRYSGTMYWEMTKDYIAQFRKKWQK